MFKIIQAFKNDFNYHSNSINTQTDIILHDNSTKNQYDTYNVRLRKERVMVQYMIVFLS